MLETFDFFLNLLYKDLYSGSLALYHLIQNKMLTQKFLPSRRHRRLHGLLKKIQPKLNRMRIHRRILNHRRILSHLILTKHQR